MAGQHFPERHAKRVQIRTDVHAHARELLGTGKLRCTGKCPRYRNRGFRRRVPYRLRQSKVNYFDCYSLPSFNFTMMLVGLMSL